MNFLAVGIWTKVVLSLSNLDRQQRLKKLLKQLYFAVHKHTNSFLQGRFISKVLTIEELRKSQLQNRKREKISVFLRAIVSAISSLLKGRNISKETKDLIKQVRIFFWIQWPLKRDEIAESYWDNFHSLSTLFSQKYKSQCYECTL